MDEQRAGGTTQEFRPTDGLARWVIRILLVQAGVTLLCLVFGVYYLKLLVGDLPADEFDDAENSVEWNLQQEASANLDWAAIGLQLPASVLFLIWMYRARRNLVPLRAGGLVYSPFWAVAGWFIPIMHLFRPFQVMREIWRASEPAGDPRQPMDWKTTPGSALLGWWWAMALFSEFSAYFFIFATFRSFASGDYMRAAVWDVAGEAFSLAAIILEALVVERVIRRQAQRHAALNAQSDPN